MQSLQVNQRHWYVTDDDLPRVVDLDQAYVIEVVGSKVVARFWGDDDVVVLHRGASFRDAHLALGADLRLACRRRQPCPGRMAAQALLDDARAHRGR